MDDRLFATRDIDVLKPAAIPGDASMDLANDFVPQTAEVVVTDQNVSLYSIIQDQHASLN